MYWPIRLAKCHKHRKQCLCKIVEFGVAFSIYMFFYVVGKLGGNEVKTREKLVNLIYTWSQRTRKTGSRPFKSDFFCAVRI